MDKEYNKKYYKNKIKNLNEQELIEFRQKASERSKQWRLENPDVKRIANKETQLKWRKLNKEKIKANTKKYRKNNIEIVRATKTKSHNKRLSKMSAEELIVFRKAMALASKEWREKYPEKFKQSIKRYGESEKGKKNRKIASAKYHKKLKEEKNGKTL